MLTANIDLQFLCLNGFALGYLSEFKNPPSLRAQIYVVTWLLINTSCT